MVQKNEGEERSAACSLWWGLGVGDRESSYKCVMVVVGSTVE